MIGKVLEGDGTWVWKARVDGKDITVPDADATWFGVDDPTDNGVGAWGFHVAAHPQYLGCALPLSVGPCEGSPIPDMPHNDDGIGVLVKVYSHATGKVAYCHVVDLGPSKSTGHAIDLMPSVWEALGIPNFREVGVTTVDYRIIGGAKYIRP